MATIKIKILKLQKRLENNQNKLKPQFCPSVFYFSGDSSAWIILQDPDLKYNRYRKYTFIIYYTYCNIPYINALGGLQIGYKILQGTAM